MQMPETSQPAGLVKMRRIATGLLALRLAVIFMHARIEGSLQQVGLRIRNRIELEIPRDWLLEHPTLSFWLDKERDYWLEVGTDFQVRLAG